MPETRTAIESTRIDQAELSRCSSIIQSLWNTRGLARKLAKAGDSTSSLHCRILQEKLSDELATSSNEYFSRKGYSWRAGAYLGQAQCLFALGEPLNARELTLRSMAVRSQLAAHDEVPRYRAEALRFVVECEQAAGLDAQADDTYSEYVSTCERMRDAGRLQSACPLVRTAAEQIKRLSDSDKGPCAKELARKTSKLVASLPNEIHDKLSFEQLDDLREACRGLCGRTRWLLNTVAVLMFFFTLLLEGGVRAALGVSFLGIVNVFMAATGLASIGILGRHSQEAGDRTLNWSATERSALAWVGTILAWTAIQLGCISLLTSLGFFNLGLLVLMGPLLILGTSPISSQSKFPRRLLKSYWINRQRAEIYVDDLAEWVAENAPIWLSAILLESEVEGEKRQFRGSTVQLCSPLVALTILLELAKLFLTAAFIVKEVYPLPLERIVLWIRPPPDKRKAVTHLRTASNRRDKRPVSVRRWALSMLGRPCSSLARAGIAA